MGKTKEIQAEIDTLEYEKKRILSNARSVSLGSKKARLKAIEERLSKLKSI